METFISIKDFVNNPFFIDQRQKALSELNITTIDAPIVQIIHGFSRLPFCFTLQSCYGHFLFHNQTNPHNIAPLLNDSKIKHVEYRIAYIAVCLQNSKSGIKLLNDLCELVAIDPEYIQFGCAEWFWQKQVNSYVLQVEPKRFKLKDRAIVDYQEALHLEKVRNEFFCQLQEIILNKTGSEFHIT